MTHRLIFAGTPDFAVPVLQALIDSEHEVVAVYTQPDRPAGRGRVLTPSPVKRLAMSHAIPVCQPVHFKDAETVEQLASWQADVMVVAAYGLLLPESVLHTPRYGCVNVHASLLPRWRGASPIQQAVLHGDAETGVTIMAMVKAMDAGDMYHRVACPVLPDDTAGSLHDRLAALGPDALLTVLSHYPQSEAIPQEPDLVTYAPKITKEQAKLDWTQAAVALERAVRAYVPWPVAYAEHGDQRMRVHAAVLLAEHSDQAPGTVVAVTPAGIDVQCGEGQLRLTQIQWPGGKAVSVAAWLHAHQDRIQVGDRLS